MKKNKTKKALASLAIVGMAMTMTPFNALADTGVTTARISGSDRIETAVKVADTFKTATTAIVAPAADANLVDALAAAPLAGKTTPILLTDNNNLSDSTKAELVKLGVKNVYVVGAISKTVVDQLNAMTGVTATALKGADRIATAAAVAGKLTNPAGSFVVGYGALADALSVASYAAANNYSILVANPDGTLPASEATFKGSKVYIIGGPTLVADITGATRLFGADRFATNQAVLKALTYTYNNVYVANGTDAHLVDSLVASSLAAVSSAPIVLADTNGAAAAADIHAKLAATAVVTALGGSSVVPDTVVSDIVAGTPDSTPVSPSSPVSISSLATTGQKVGTGAKATPAVALVNDAVTVSASVDGASAANASITYLVTSSDNITAKDANGNTLVDTTLNSPVIIGNDTFKASYSVPADASGNVKAVFTSTASSQETFNVVVEAPFSNAGQPVMSDVASIEWGAPGTMVLSPVYKSSNPDSLNYSASGAVTKGLVPIVATMLPSDGSTTALDGQNVKFTMTNTGSSASANAFFTDAGGSAMVASGASVGKGGSTTPITYVATTDANGQAIVYINANLPTNNSVADLGAIMNVSVQAQLVNGGGSSTAGYYQWKAVSQPAKIANVTPSAMLNPTGLEGGGTVTNDSAETATSGSTMTIGGTVQDAAGNPVKGAVVAIQDYDVRGTVGSNNVQNDAYVATDGTTQLFSAVNYPMVTTDSNGNWSVKVTANIPVTQSIANSITRYYAFYVPPTIAISTGQSLPNTVTALTFVGNSNSGNFIDLVWQQGQTVQTIGVSHTSLLPTYSTLSTVPQTMSFTNVVGNHEEMYAAAYNQTGTIVAPAAGNQFDGYALTYDLSTPNGIHFASLGADASPTQLPLQTDGTGIGRIVASYNQVSGFVLNALYYSNGTVYYQAPTNPDGSAATAVTPTGFDPTVFASSAYDGSGQLHFYLNSDQSVAVKTSGTAGSVNINVNAYSNTSAAGVVDTSHAQGSASGTINATFAASNTVGSIGVVGDLSGINNYYPLLDGNAAPASTLTVAGVALPDKNLYDVNKNGKFVIAPFNAYPAIATVPSQGLTMNMNADKNGTFSNVDGYVLASTPTNVSVNVNSYGEVSVNNVKLWTAASGFKVVGYMPVDADGSINVIEQGNTLATATNFVAYNIASVGAAPSLVANWTVDKSALPGDFEGFLGFDVVAGQLIPQVASYYASNNHFYTPLATDSTSTMSDGTFLPVTATTAYVSDKYSEATTITVTNSLNDQKATVTTNFTAATGGLVAIHATPSSVNSVLGGSQSITLTAQDAYGNPISNQTIYLQTGIQGLWITQVNGTPITGSVNMGSTSSTSMQTLNTPVPLFNLGSGTIAPAYTSASVAGITAYHLNDNTTPIVALTTGVDGTVSITLVDGNVTYVANTSAGNGGTNSYAVDAGATISQTRLNFYSGIDTTGQSLGSTLVNWTGNVSAPTVKVTGITVTGAASTVVTGATDQMTAAVLPANATDPSVVWSVVPGAGTTATIDATGLLTATGAGTVTVKATNAVSGVSGTAVITVTAATVNPFTVAPKFNVFEIDGTLDLTKAATVKATGTEGTVAGVPDATGAFKISTATFATETVKVQAYDAQGNAVGAAVSVVVF